MAGAYFVPKYSLQKNTKRFLIGNNTPMYDRAILLCFEFLQGSVEFSVLLVTEETAFRFVCIV